MMEFADEFLLNEATSPSHIVENATQSAAHPDGRMVFHCRPDLSGRRLLFQERNSRASEQQQTAPVQLLAVDGCSHLGFSVMGPGTDSPFYPAQDADKLARILVTTNPPTDPSSIIRLQRMQLTIAVAAVANFLLTVALLCPADPAAWYHVDAYQSPTGLANVQRVVAVRPILLIIAMVSNIFLVLTTYLKMDALLTVYVSVIALVDILSLISLLPHALFLLRFLFDVFLAGLALELRTHLVNQSEHTWFLTSFHRLRV